MIETDLTSLHSAIYGILRLIAGYKDWQTISDNPNNREWLPTLINDTTKQLAEVSADFQNVDPKVQAQLMRKLKGYQQLALIEKFCFDEVEW